MPDTPAPKTVRYRETKEFKPFGEPARTMTRVVEAEGPVPARCEATTDEPCDWNVAQPQEAA